MITPFLIEEIDGKEHYLGSTCCWESYTPLYWERQKYYPQRFILGNVPEHLIALDAFVKLQQSGVMIYPDEGLI